jgi:hypothetical protein
MVRKAYGSGRDVQDTNWSAGGRALVAAEDAPSGRTAGDQGDAGALPPPSLDKERKGRTCGTWGRQQRSCYHRLTSWLLVKEDKGAGLLWITLTSSPSSRGRSLWKDHKELL